MELARAYVQIIPTTENIAGGISSALVPEATSAGDEAGDSAGNALVDKIKKIVAAAGIGMAIKKGFDAIGDLASYGDTIDKQSQKIGISAKAYQEWDAVLQHSGTSINTMQAAMKKMTAAAADGSEAFQVLGISQEEAMSMSQEDLFARVIEGLQGMEEGTERAALAQDLLGRGAQEMAALLNTSAEDTQKMKDAVNELGGVMSDDAVKASAAYQDALQDMQTAFSGLGRGLLSEFLPGLTDVMNGIAQVFSGNGEGVQMVIDGIGSLLESIAAAIPQFLQTGADIIMNIITGIGNALPGLASAGMEMIPQIINGLLTQLPTMITQGGNALQNFLNGLLSNLPALMTGGTGMLGSVVSGIISALPGIVSAAISVVFGLIDTIVSNLPAILAAGVEMVTNIVTGIIDTLPDVIDAALEMVGDFLDQVSDNLPNMLQKGTEIIANVVSGILSSLPQIVASAASAAAEFIATLVSNFPSFLSKGVEILGKVVAGIIQAIPQIISAAGSAVSDFLSEISGKLPDILSKGKDIITNLADGVKNNIFKIVSTVTNIFNDFKSEITGKDWGSVGLNIINGVKNGITNNLHKLKEAAKEAAKKAFDAAKSFLGISSPSKKFMWIADMSAEGLVKGNALNARKFQRAGREAARAYLGAWDGMTLSAYKGANYQPAGGGNVNADLLEAVNGLGDRISRMRMVTDTGALVGELAEGMNYRLGYMAKMEAIS